MFPDHLVLQNESPPMLARQCALWKAGFYVYLFTAHNSATTKHLFK